MDLAENNGGSEESFEVIDNGDLSQRHLANAEQLETVEEIIPTPSLELPSEAGEIFVLRLRTKKPVSVSSPEENEAPGSFTNVNENKEKEIKSESDFKFKLNSDDDENETETEDFRDKFYLENEMENLKRQMKFKYLYTSDEIDEDECQVRKTHAVQNGGMEKMAERTRQGQDKNSSSGSQDLKLLWTLLFGLFLGLVLQANLNQTTQQIPAENPEPETDPNFRDTIKKMIQESLKESLNEMHLDGVGGKNEKATDLKVTSCSVAMEILPSSRSQKQTIHPHGNNKSLEVLCDFETDGGAWTIIQKRSSGLQQEFNRNWTEYEKGFGFLDGNFWLGLENIHALTKNGDQELRIDLEDFEGVKKWAKYLYFSISDASDFYRLLISGFSGNCGDSLTNNPGMRFSTKDKDQDYNWHVHCAEHRGAGWWFHNCDGQGVLNGLYRERREHVPEWKGILWQSWKGGKCSLAKTEMKIRKRK